MHIFRFKERGIPARFATKDGFSRIDWAKSSVKNNYFPCEGTI